MSAIQEAKQKTNCNFKIKFKVHFMSFKKINTNNNVIRYWEQVTYIKFPNGL